jgi:hypothetical protein
MPARAMDSEPGTTVNGSACEVGLIDVPGAHVRASEGGSSESCYSNFRALEVRITQDGVNKSGLDRSHLCQVCVAVVGFVERCGYHP